MLAGRRGRTQVFCFALTDGDAVAVRDDPSALQANAMIMAGSSGRYGSLPIDFLQSAARNVRIASLVIGSVWVIGWFINDVVWPLGWFGSSGAPAWPWPGRLFVMVDVALALAVFFLAPRLSPQRAIDLGLGFEIATALLIGLAENWRPTGHILSVSPICILILAYPAIAPSTLGKTFAASVAAASMSVVGLAVAWLRGATIDITPFGMVWDLLPNYLSAVLAVVPAAVIRHLGRQVQTARELGSYRLEGLIGSGGMGEVYRATHRFLARPAAVKLIRPEVLERRTPDRARVVVERFRREAEAASNLRSPHTIALYDFGVSDRGVFYYVMELLDGCDLERLVEQFAPVPPERAIHLLRQACDSIAEAHARGLMHRDIKPSNIYTCRLGLTVDFVKVLDFGLVKPQPGLESDTPKLTATGATTPGTPAFMAPESVFGDTAPDHRADIYALGCVGYWLLTGELVFDALSSKKMLMHHVATPPEPPSRRSRSVIPPELDALILACLAKQPEDRPSSATELSDRLALCPVREPWTIDRAREWWAEHLPAAAKGGTPTDPSDAHVDFTGGLWPTARS